MTTIFAKKQKKQTGIERDKFLIKTILRLSISASLAGLGIVLSAVVVLFPNIEFISVTILTFGAENFATGENSKKIILFLMIAQFIAYGIYYFYYFNKFRKLKNEIFDVTLNIRDLVQKILHNKFEDTNEKNG